MRATCIGAEWRPARLVAPPRCAAGFARVVLIGPSHFVPFRGLATSGAAAFATPLGRVEVDAGAESLLELPFVVDSPRAHHREHSLEVELPFLQEVLGRVPDRAAGGGRGFRRRGGPRARAALGRRRDAGGGELGPDPLPRLRAASRVDAATARAIEELRWDAIEPEHACGWAAIRGLLWVAGRRGLGASTLDLRNSGDTAGPRDAVVGYGAWALT